MTPQELLDAFQKLGEAEKGIVAQLVQALQSKPAAPPTPYVHPSKLPSRAAPFRGYTLCADCGEHALCYSRRGVPRCDHCRRKLALRDDESESAGEK